MDIEIFIMMILGITMLIILPIMLALWCKNRELTAENKAYENKLDSLGVVNNIKGLVYNRNVI